MRHCSLCCQAEDGIRDLVRSRGLGDVDKRQAEGGRGTVAWVDSEGFLLERREADLFPQRGILHERLVEAGEGAAGRLAPRRGEGGVGGGGGTGGRHTAFLPTQSGGRGRTRATTGMGDKKKKKK